ncbi:PqqD family protein [Deinococcus sp. PEB2-63]
MNHKYEVNPDVLVTDLDDELALLDPHTSQMYTLNAVGRVVWQTLVLGRADEDELVQVVTQTFEVVDEQAREDLRSLLGDLERQSLVWRR